jgi:hypothetical protein
MRAGVAVALAVLAACSRSSGEGAAGSPSTPASASTSTSASAPATASASAPTADFAPAGEAERTKLPSLERDPLLRPYLAKLRDHFGKDARGPFAMQRIPLAVGRVGVLLSLPDESNPLVLAVDRDQLLFAKEHPTAGISPPALHPTLAPAPERGVAVFAYVQSLHLVAARMWADDANPYAEVDVFHPEACDALTVAYATEVGWIVACASSTGTRVQRLRDDLTSAWGAGGVRVGTPGPVTREDIAFEGPSAWRLTQRARAIGGDRTLTFRYGADAQPL